MKTTLFCQSSVQNVSQFPAKVYIVIFSTITSSYLISLARLTQSVTCLTIVGSIPSSATLSVVIDHEIFSTLIRPLGQTG